VFDVFASLRIAVEDADARSLFQESRRSGRADSAGAAGDEYALVFQSTHKFV
jgi:hypothetical protein